MIVVNIIENLMITVIIVVMEVKWIVKVMIGGMGFMTENKRFPTWYLRFCMILAFISGLGIGRLFL